MSPHPSDRPSDSGLLTVPEACEMLSISRGTLYNLFAAGHLPRIKFGKAVRVRYSDLVDLVNRSEA